MNIYRAISICFAANLLFSCGMFSPRDNVESPETGLAGVDRFGISKILIGTGRNFERPFYEDIFADDFIYIYNRIYFRNKDEHISYLEHIGSEFSTAKIEWVEDTSDGKRDSYFSLDSGTLYREYYIWKVRPLTADQINDYSGKSRFDIRFIRQKNSWAITRWYDESEDGFFHHKIDE